MPAWYMTPAVKNLLSLIRLHEGGKAGYNADYRQDDRWTLTDKTFDQVRDLGRSQVTTGGRAGGKEASSAIGGYQFLTRTLDDLKKSLKLTGREIMTGDFQDELAVALMNGRGFVSFVRGTLSTEAFANNLAKEWASLPVVTRIKGQKRTVVPGETYYAGDGLNAAGHKPAVILDALRAVKATTFPPEEPQPATHDAPVIDPTAATPVVKVLPQAQPPADEAPDDPPSPGPVVGGIVAAGGAATAAKASGIPLGLAIALGVAVLIAAAIYIIARNRR